MKYILLFFFMTTNFAWGQDYSYNDWSTAYEAGIKVKDSLPEEAMVHFEKAYDLLFKYRADSEFIKNNDTQYIASLNKLASAFLSVNGYEQSLALLKKCVELSKSSNYALSEIDLLELIGSNLRDIGEYDDALEIFEIRSKVIIVAKGKISTEYADGLLNQATIYRELGKPKLAKNLCESGLETIKKVDGTDNILFAEGLTGLAQINWDLGFYSEAIKNQKEALRIFESKSGKDKNYAGGLYTLSFSLEEKGKFNESIAIQKEALDILEKEVGKDHIYYVTIKSNLGITYESLGEYENALEYLRYGLEETNEAESNYGLRAENLANLYRRLGQYDKAEKYYDLARKNFESTIGNEHPRYSKLINNIGKIYFAQADYKTALKYFEEALNLVRTNSGEDDKGYNGFLNDVAVTLIELNRADQAIDYLSSNLEQNFQVSDTLSESFYIKQFNLGRAYYRTGQYSQAEKPLISSSEGLARILGKNHISSALATISLADNYMALSKYDQALSLYKSSNEKLVDQIDQIFKFSNEADRGAYLSTLKRSFNDLYKISSRYNFDLPKLNELNLNNQLMLKGILLSNSKNIFESLASLNDSVVEQNLHDYRVLRAELEKARSEDILAKKKLGDSLKNLLEKKETSLVNLFDEHFKDKVKLDQDWKSIRQNLNQNEVVLEFAFYNVKDSITGNLDLSYVAYIFDKDSEFPEVVPLFKESEFRDLLQNKSLNELYTSKDLYQMLWEPLTELVKDYKTIYYSASGVLNKISIPAIYHESLPLINEFDMVQLSSTTALNSKRSQPNLEDALFVGGVEYEYIDNPTQTDSLETMGEWISATSILSDGTKTRGETWTYLPGTLNELANIEKVYESHGQSFNSLTSYDATETKIKSYSKDSPSILHLATHGYFYENLKARGHDYLDLSIEDQFRLSADPLLRSGLILAGANYAWKNQGKTLMQDDGILTSLEVTNLDLSNTDMVVLSACDTGLGDIEGWEGVYGLQRAFKVAGAEILIMSLWKVPDEETAQFMGTFYSKWFELNDVRLAFSSTQRMLAKKYNDSPFKWAAFVMIE